MAMNCQQSASRITDVVPAKFLCDSRTMEKIAQSQVKEDKALLDLENKLSVLKSRQRCLNDELETAERLISHAVGEQTRLRSSIATNRSLIAPSPVRALSGEVLSDFFLHYIALSRTAQDNVFKEIVASHRIHAPILLVCRRWHTTALADPRLWTTIPLIGSGHGTSFLHPLTSRSPEVRMAYWKALQCRIDRRSALPLHLLFHYKRFEPIGDPIYSMSSLQTFIRLFPRANTISLEISYHEPDELIPALSCIMDDADIPHAGGVHTARIDVDDDAFGRKILSVIPNVEVLEMSFFAVNQWLIDSSTAGHCLRSLHLLTGCSTIQLVQVLDLLERAPLLATLKVFRICITSSGGPLRVVTHTCLSTFHVASPHTDENDAVFGHLTLPALSYVASGFSPALGPRPSNIAFLQRSGCMLVSLAFRRCRVD